MLQNLERHGAMFKVATGESLRMAILNKLSSQCRSVFNKVTVIVAISLSNAQKSNSNIAKKD